MGTPAIIAVRRSDDSMSFVTVNYDGYMADTGKKLFENYNSLELAEKLISGGDISVLGTVIDIPEGITHNFGTPVKGITVYYKRDRGESNVDTRNTSADMFPYVADVDSTYTYVFDELLNSWVYVTGRFTSEYRGNSLENYTDKFNN